MAVFAPGTYSPVSWASIRHAVAPVVMGLALVCQAQSSRADLAHGTVDLSLGPFDFSTQQQYQSYSEYIDIGWCYVTDPPLGHQLCMWNDAGILAVADTTVEDISYAPPGDQPYDFAGVPPVEGQSYVMKTGDGFYLKFAVRLFQPVGGGLLIEYYVQMDGSNDLDDDFVAVRPTTWGRVKALYH